MKFMNFDLDGANYCKFIKCLYQFDYHGHIQLNTNNPVPTLNRTENTACLNVEIVCASNWTAL